MEYPVRRLPVCSLPTPELVYEKIKTIPKGEVMTIKELRTKLAEDFDADYTCPLTPQVSSSESPLKQPRK
jgi:hypothetical protein